MNAMSKRLALPGLLLLALGLAGCAGTGTSVGRTSDSSASSAADSAQTGSSGDGSSADDGVTVTTEDSASDGQTQRQQLIEEINRDGSQMQAETFREAAPEPVEPPENDVVALDYEQVELRQILTDLAEELDISLVIDPSISAQVSIRTAQDRPLGYDDIWPLMRMLARQAGVTIEREGNVYQVRPESDANLPANITMPDDVGDGAAARMMQVTPFTYVSVASAEEMLTPLVESDGRIDRVGSSNTLLITASESRLQRINELIALIDDDPFRSQGIRLYQLDSAAAGDVATELQDVLSMIEGNAPAYQVQPLERLNALLVTAPAERGFREIDRWVGFLDSDSQERSEQLFQYRVKNLDATELASTLSEIFDTGEDESDQPQAGQAGQPSGQGGQQGGFRSPDQAGPPGTDTGAQGQNQSQAQDQNQNPDPSQTQNQGQQTPAPSSNPAQTGADGTAAQNAQGQTAGSGARTGSDTLVTEVAVSADLEVTIVADDATNTLLIRSTPRDYQQLLATINQLDSVPLQVMINAAIAQITLTDDSSFGVDWSRIAENLGSGSAELSTSFLPEGGEESSGLGGLLFNRSFLDGAARIDATLEAIATNNEVRLLARPSLTVVNNQEGLIRIGSEVPVQLGQTATDIGTTTNIQYRPTGIELTITPRINDDGVVNLSIAQELSSVSESSGVNNNPIFQNQEIETSVVVRDNENVVLGGLIQDNNDTLNTGVPLLNRIPGLGRLFSYQQNNNERQELFIVLRPEIVNLNDRAGDRYQQVAERFETAAQMIQDSEF